MTARTAEQRRAEQAAARAQLIEDIEWMAETGASLTEATRRLDKSDGALWVALRRAGRSDLYQTLARRECDWNRQYAADDIPVSRIMPHVGWDEKLARKNERRRAKRSAA